MVSDELTFEQDTQLYISDPKALYNILIKDQHIFEETTNFIQYVVDSSASRFMRDLINNVLALAQI